MKRTYVRYGVGVLQQLPRRLDKHKPPVLTRGGLVAEIAAIAGARSALDAYELRVVAAIEALDDSGLDAAGVLRSVGRVSSRSASRVTATAARMTELPHTAAALAAGHITAEHANVIADAAGIAPPELVDGELPAVAKAAPADVFAKRARQWLARQQSQSDAAARHEHQRRLRSVKSWTDNDGMGVWMARLDPVTNASITAALNTRYEQMWRNDGGRDINTTDTATPTPQQRMADAFVSLITSTSQTPTATTRAPHPRQQMLVTVDLTRLRHDNPGGTAQLADGTPLPQTVLEHLACNSEMTGIIFAGPSQPIWVGRTRRHATTAQWKALIARDQGCVGCAGPIDRCEAHHIKPWNQTGGTNIDNLVLVCSRCHHNIHDRNMHLTQTTTGQWQITPRAGPQRHQTAA